MLTGLLHRLVESRATDEDLKRQEFIMNVLLLGSLVLAGFAAGILAIGVLFLDPDRTKHSVSLVACIVIVGFFVYLYRLSKHGHHRPAAFGFLGSFTLGGVYTICEWGIRSREAWLIFALVIITSGIVLSLRAALGSLLLVTLATVLVHVMETSGFTQPVIDLRGPTLEETVFSLITLGILALVSWLHGRDIYHALERARASETALRKEKDMLEIRVDERTKELRQVQQDDITHLYRFAQFGRLTSGVLHDLLSPLTAVSLNLEELGRSHKSDVLREAIENTKRIERFVETTQREVQEQHDATDFSVRHALRDAVEVLRYRARKSHVKVSIEPSSETILHGSPVKFHQIASNLLSNAIDASPEGTVRISLTTTKTRLRINVVDNGSGIPPENLVHIFEPLFTTKDIEHGTGLGLSICKEIVEQEFKGRISVESKPGKGSTFKVDIPL